MNNISENALHLMKAQNLKGLHDSFEYDHDFDIDYANYSP